MFQEFWHMYNEKNICLIESLSNCLWQQILLPKFRYVLLSLFFWFTVSFHTYKHQEWDSCSYNIHLMYFFQNSPSFHIHLKIPPTYSYSHLCVRNRDPLYASAVHGQIVYCMERFHPRYRETCMVLGSGNFHIWTFNSI